jgi:hypothetical protein
MSLRVQRLSAAEHPALPGLHHRPMACLFHHIFQQLGLAFAHNHECHSVTPVETTADFGNDDGNFHA